MTYVRSKLLILFVASFVVSTLSTARAQGWGNLSGRFWLAGPAPAPALLNMAGAAGFCGALFDESVVVSKKGELANVVVWVRTPKEVKAHPDYTKLLQEKAVINNNRCRFDPHVVICRVGQPLEIKNSDPDAHNTNAALVAGNPFNFILPANQAQEIKSLAMVEPVPASVTCNIHRWMKGWLVVPPTPYAAVSGDDGKFEIKNLPVGTELEFQAWQEKKGDLDKATINGKDAGWTKGRFKMTIKPGDNDLGDIKVAL
jgi:hypothetical protein